MKRELCVHTHLVAAMTMFLSFPVGFESTLKTYKDDNKNKIYKFEKLIYRIIIRWRKIV